MKHVKEPVPLGEGMEARVYQEWDFSSSLINEWDSMARDYGDAGIFLSPGWFELWWSAFGKPGKLFVVALEEQGQTKAIFPCWINGSDDKRGDESITSLTNDHSFYFDVLVKPTARQKALSNFISVIQRIKPHCMMDFDHLCESSGTGADFESELRRRGYPVNRYIEPYGPYVDLKSSSWEDYYKNLSRNHKNNLRKRRHKAEKEGKVSFEIVRRSPFLDDLLTEALEVEVQSWKGPQGTAIKCQPEVEKFYRRIARWAGAQGGFYLFVLRLNGRIIAFNLCVGCQKTLFLLKTGYDQVTYSHLSPGKLLSFEMLKYLFEEPGFQQLNFPGPCYPWIMEWTSGHRSYEWLHVYPKSLSGWCRYEYRYGWKAYLKRFESVQRIKALVGCRYPKGNDKKETIL